ncbi:MAG: DUF167 domain-containing protein [Patescibacteria group bacterium]
MIRITIRIIPNASKTEIVERNGTFWKIRIAAPPIDGRANKALIEFLSETLNCSKSHIRIIKGFASREKIIEVPNE